MKPLPQPILLGLLLALCALCTWQWHRETALRALAAQQSTDLTALQTAAAAATAQLNAQTAEILRLTSSLTELRNAPPPPDPAPALLETNLQLRETAAKQATALTAANTAIQQANQTIQKLTAERDALAKRLNDTTAKYNKLAAP